MGRRPEAGGSLWRREGFGRARAIELNRGLLDGHTDEGAPLSPGAVVIAYSFLSEDIFQDKPGVSAPFANTAVRDRLAFAVDALTRVNTPELINALEAAIFGDRGCPWDVLRSGNV